MDFDSVNLVMVALVVMGAVLATCSLEFIIVLRAGIGHDRVLPVMISIILPLLLLAMGLAWGVGIMPFLVWLIVVAAAALLSIVYLVGFAIKRGIGGKS
jgi:hypothetical protein